jgi:hypothetical protein
VRRVLCRRTGRLTAQNDGFWPARAGGGGGRPRVVAGGVLPLHVARPQVRAPVATGGAVHFHALLFIFCRESLRKYTGWCVKVAFTRVGATQVQRRRRPAKEPAVAGDRRRAAHVPALPVGAGNDVTHTTHRASLREVRVITLTSRARSPHRSRSPTRRTSGTPGC